MSEYSMLYYNPKLLERETETEMRRGGTEIERETQNPK